MYTREKMLEQQWREPKNPIVRVRPPWGPHFPKLVTFMRLLPCGRFMRRREVETAIRARHGNKGYQCPRCWTWHPTPPERLACRRSHHTVAIAVKETP